MKTNVLEKLNELNKVSNWITTHELLNELCKLGESQELLNRLIDKDIIDRVVDEKVDICSFNTKKFKRLIKIKNLSI